ncbi:hypothetical protein DL546_000347 [Coniochaeta pulveracea]|uniref:Uncharacterized protein n=1 Tax=Coniochaeta pulveracea TaxID=177199 RepID=A0A420Y153_9PEZI|nr:hypothetical protein DL546_000347 [Coniochaeta pulveracea]
MCRGGSLTNGDSIPSGELPRSSRSARCDGQIVKEEKTFSSQRDRSQETGHSKPRTPRAASIPPPKFPMYNQQHLHTAASTSWCAAMLGLVTQIWLLLILVS